LATLRGHRGEVFGVAFRPDGRCLATSGADGTVRLWDVSEAQLLATLKGHKQPAYAVVFDHDGQRVASGSQDRTVKMWNAQLHGPGRTASTRP
jgi:WD40 repeat protein